MPVVTQKHEHPDQRLPRGKEERPKVSAVLPETLWEKFEYWRRERDMSVSHALRVMIEEVCCD